MSASDRYPLTWPDGWTRTRAADRKPSPFAKTIVGTKSKWDAAAQTYKDVPVRRDVDLSAADAADRLQYQLDRLGATDAILSTNQPLRIDGRPRSNTGEPADPGAAIYFRLRGADRVLACDRWTRVADNIAALAAHIDALRRIERYGVGDLNQAFAGYVGLPARGQTWRSTLGFGPDDLVDAPAIDRAFRERARDVHPDREHGSHDAMASLTAARVEALHAIGATRKQETRP